MIFDLGSSSVSTDGGDDSLFSFSFPVGLPRRRLFSDLASSSISTDRGDDNLFSFSFPVGLPHRRLFSNLASSSILTDRGARASSPLRFFARDLMSMLSSDLRLHRCSLLPLCFNYEERG
ncbi:hypothetical protein LINGRAHAP2_LOCUS31495 [Linum grandiflorum]